MKRVETILWISGVLLLAMYFFGLAFTDSARVEGISEFAAYKHSVAADSRSSASVRVPASKHAATTALPVALPADVSASDAAAVADDISRNLSFETDVVLAQTASAVASPKAPQATAAQPFPAIAILRIPRLALEVPVAKGTGARVLRRGAGLIDGSAAPGSVGNVAIAAHRDSYFRPLADVVVGDLIELESLSRVDSYRIAELSVVEPTDVHVLAPTSEATLTLVTCFPFRFVGRAPQRFIVRAVATEFDPQPPRRRT